MKPGDKCLSAMGEYVGTCTPGSYPCLMTGCKGTRVRVVWGGGKITFPCTAGLTWVENKGMWQIMGGPKDHPLPPMEAPPPAEDTQVIVTYSHKHGIDTWVCANSVEAEKSIVRIMLDYYDEAKRPEEILDLIGSGAHEDAVAQYCEDTGESFDVVGVTDARNRQELGSWEDIQLKAREILDRLKEK